jgi:hypothetical protein
VAFRELKSRLKAVDDTFKVDRISEVDVITNGEVLENKIETVRKTETVLERLRSCRSAGQVFLEFSRDAAAAKVDEMLHGSTPDSRHRAQDTVLQYALGKPINRVMSMSMHVADASEEEMKNDIRKLLAELNFAEGSGETSSLFIGAKGGEGEDQAQELQTQPRLSGEVCEEHEEDSDDVDPEPRGEDDDRGL